MHKWLDKLGHWFYLILDNKPPFITQIVEDAPDVFEDKNIYLIGESQPWVASFLCPCGCKEVVSLSLIPTDRPRWKVSINKSNLITLHPSIRRIKGCRSHFFIREGRLLWAKNYRQ